MSEAAMKGFFACACLLGALALAGCSSGKHGECVALVTVINSGIEELEKSRKQEKNDPSGTIELRSMAERAETTATEANKVGLTYPELKGLSQRYQDMSKEIAKAAREVADAAEKKDLEQLSKAQSALAEAVKKEDPILEELNKFCAP